MARAIRAARPEVAVAEVQVDLADRAATTAAAERIVREHPRTDLLINNAGVALAGRFDEVTLEEYEWVLEVNFHAPVRLTHHLLPTMQAGAHLVNVSSLYGLISPPGQSAYSASKFALRGFSQVLRGELAERGIGVTTVHPGGINTRIAADARVGSGVDRAQYAVGLEQFSRLLTYPPQRPPPTSCAPSSGGRPGCSSPRARRCPTCWPGCSRSATWRPSRGYWPGRRVTAAAGGRPPS
ncbi:hypothetical protein BJF90_09805 [Pseudonocardia sp. CNS-004]|nr:hypothetical protein BJF90_09805 [Pseudonocardia sp. CNS-004]